MDWLQVILLAILQGVLEFLPISSSGHLILFPAMLGWDDQGALFDIATHFGSLVAMVIYFRKEVISLLQLNAYPNVMRLRINLIIATVPIILVGFFFGDLILILNRSPVIVAFATIFFGVLLWLSDRVGKKISNIEGLNYRSSIIIGISQCLALIPGTSRSGISITAGRLLGLDKESAVRFSFLLALPTLLASFTWQVINYSAEAQSIGPDQLVIAIFLSAIASYLTIKLFLQFIRQIDFSWFMLYRIGLGLITLYLFI
jgi:undecaprenyl-diphosphatase